MQIKSGLFRWNLRIRRSIKAGDNLEDLFMNVVRKNQKAGEIHGNIIKQNIKKPKEPCEKSLSGISSSYICHGIYIVLLDDKCLCRKCLELVDTLLLPG